MIYDSCPIEPKPPSKRSVQNENAFCTLTTSFIAMQWTAALVQFVVQIMDKEIVIHLFAELRLLF